MGGKYLYHFSEGDRTSPSIASLAPTLPAPPSWLVAEAVASRPSINDVSSSLVRIEAGNLVAMGCSFAGPAKSVLRFAGKGCTPPNFPANLGLHPRIVRPLRQPA